MTQNTQSYRVTVILTVVGMLIACPAMAEPLAAADSEGYAYRFEDESMLGTTIQSVGDIYKGRAKFARVMLLRPRIDLRTQILQSVEDL